MRRVEFVAEKMSENESGHVRKHGNQNQPVVFSDNKSK